MPDLTTHWVGLAALTVFVVAYAAVMAEEQLHLRKSVPALVAAGLIWLLIAGVHAQYGAASLVTEAVQHTLLEFAELFLFLLVAMTYVNTLQERGVFDALRTWLLRRQLSLRALFWVTGALAFCLSTIANNLTTALVMGAVAMAVGQGNPRFIALACLNIVVAANAGGVFSPFGDITTLMVWQSGHVEFAGFFPLFLPALVNWLAPAGLLTLVIGPGQPARVTEATVLKAGAWSVVALFLVTTGLTVVLHNTLHLPPAVGMMFGLGLLTLYSSVFNWRARDPMIVDEPGRCLRSSNPAAERRRDDGRANRRCRVRRGRRSRSSGWSRRSSGTP
jgi:Na+/H+ antiporter NhaD/arsenite permease-like protein